jgi:hypothetical protein
MDAESSTRAVGSANGRFDHVRTVAFFKRPVTPAEHKTNHATLIAGEPISLANCA